MKIVFLSKIRRSFERKRRWTPTHWVYLQIHVDSFDARLIQIASLPRSFVGAAISSPVAAGSDRLLQTLLESAPHFNYIEFRFINFKNIVSS